ncbi:protoporphyrinogen oxidase [Myxococcota bacterium]|nr:protoporphyrinogen oxidase [Myxococcota bacterium]
MHTQVCVIGGGISGLSVAAGLALDAQAGEQAAVVLLEGGDRPGGVTWSEVKEGRVLDHGPSSWLSGEPALDRLLELAGLQDQLLSPSPASKARFIWARGERHRVPMAPPSLLSTRLIPWGTRLRLFGEPFVGRGDPEADESVADFMARRLGEGVVDRLVSPMVAGIYGADPRKLSVRAAFPKLWQLEHDHRSLLIGAMKSRSPGPRPQLQALRGGAGTLSRGLAGILGDRVKTGRRVQAVEPMGEGWAVHTDEGRITADAVVLATPAHAQAATLRGLDAQAARALDEIPYAPIAVVTMAWPAEAFSAPVEGFGVLVAGDSRDEAPVLGTIFVSSTFPDHAPPGEVLLRTMVGGQPDPSGAALDEQALLARVHAAHAKFCGAPQGEPRLVHVVRHPQAIPQYSQGHLRRVAVARQAQVRHPGLFLAGSHLDGPGVRDCARTSATVAAQVRRWLATGETDSGVPV